MGGAIEDDLKASPPVLAIVAVALAASPYFLKKYLNLNYG
jgi:hypothetical protein